MTEARLFTNVRTAWVERRAVDGPIRIGSIGGPIRIEIDALWVEAGYKVIGFAARNGRVDTFRPVFTIELECDPLEHDVALYAPPEPQLARADLTFRDGTRIGLQVRDRQRPVDVLDATEDGDIYRNNLWEMMSDKVREYPINIE